MRLVFTKHWKIKRKFRPNITHNLIEYAIFNSQTVRDKLWKNALNAVCKIPINGRTLKVVYRRKSRKYLIITAILA